MELKKEQKEKLMNMAKKPKEYEGVVCVWAEKTIDEDGEDASIVNGFIEGEFSSVSLIFSSISEHLEDIINRLRGED